MITKNPMQLKAFIKKMSAEKNISPQLVMQNYMLERLLERISLSKYKNNFILKGGFLISVVVGLQTRSTMDLDTTITGFTLTNENIKEIFSEICAINIDDNVSFAIGEVSDIREADDYPGSRLHLKANYFPISVPLTVDITTGDIITPKEIEFTFPLLFDNRSISILAYNLETVLAEKIETVLSRSIANTRIRDFYDIYILYSLRNQEINYDTLKKAIQKTTEKRGSTHILRAYEEIIFEIRNNKQLQKFWNNYQKKFNYAKEISFDDICDNTLNLLKKLME